MQTSNDQLVAIQGALTAGVPLKTVAISVGMTEEEIRTMADIEIDTSCEIIQSVQEDLLVEGEIQSCISIRDLDSSMLGLAERIVKKMDTFALMATSPSDMTLIVDSLAKLRESFHGKATTTVNIQNISGGGGGGGGGGADDAGGSQFQSRLKR